MPSNSLPDGDLNLPEMKTKSPTCLSGDYHMYVIGEIGLNVKNELDPSWFMKNNFIGHRKWRQIKNWIETLWCLSIQSQ